jgi:hypothetical protein
MTGKILPFPARGPFVIEVRRDGNSPCSYWLVVAQSFGWAHADRDEANAEAIEIVAGFGVAVKTAAP